MAKKYKAIRNSIDFDWEFVNGTTSTFKYLSQSTNQIDAGAAIDIKDNSALLQHSKSIFAANVVGDETLKIEMVKELQEGGNLYEIVNELENEVKSSAKKK